MNKNRIFKSVVITSALFISILLGLYSYVENYKAMAQKFFLTAQFKPGKSNWRTWTTKIDDSGEVSYVSSDFDKRFDVSREDLHRLLSAVEDNNFFALDDRYEPADSYKDFDELSVAITLDNNEKKVSVYGDEFLLLSDDVSRDKKQEILRFNCILNAVLKIAPSENVGQTIYPCEISGSSSVGR